MKTIILCLIAYAVLKLIEKYLNALKRKKSAATSTKLPEISSTENEDLTTIDFSQSYQSRYLLTRNEWQQFKKLKEITDKKNLMICPKVRLLDIIEPRKGVQKYKTLFYKIQAKHVDFVICDQDLHIKAILELDDNSHNDQERKERDEFVDKILTSVGYKIIHTRYITDELLRDL